ncbi:defensin J1-2-like [Capsicum galapagoense]
MAANSLKLFATLSLLFMLLFATEMGVTAEMGVTTEMGVTEARNTCYRDSGRFRGPCFNNNNNRNQNCDFICTRCEKFLSGRCRNRKCVCARRC